MFQSVEYLLERELNAAENGPVAPSESVPTGRSAGKRQDRGARGDQQWQVCDDKTKSYEPSNHSSRTYHHTAQPDAACTALMDVCVQPDHDSAFIYGKHCRRDLFRVYQVIAASTEIHRTPD